MALDSPLVHLSIIRKAKEPCFQYAKPSQTKSLLMDGMMLN